MLEPPCPGNVPVVVDSPGPKERPVSVFVVPPIPSVEGPSREPPMLTPVGDVPGVAIVSVVSSVVLGRLSLMRNTTL